MNHSIIAREPHALGLILVSRRPIGVNVPVLPRRRFVVILERGHTRGARIDLRLQLEWRCTAEPCRCGSGVMRDHVRYLGCAVCLIPREPLIERARLFPGRAV